MPLPWFLYCFSSIKEHRYVDGYLCYGDERDYEVGEDRPFLSTPAKLRAPPPYENSARFNQSFGIHQPCCFGHCLVVPWHSNNMIWVTFLLLFVPCITWAVFVAPELHKDFGYWPWIVTAILFSLTVFFLLLSYLVEPGILPHIEFEDRSDEEKPKTITFVVLNGLFFAKPTFRAQTSKFTHSCIEGFDHYCPYVGNAVGKRNYRYFILFLSFAISLCAWVVVTSVLLVYKRRENDDKHDFWHAVKESAGGTVLGGFALIMGISILFLLAYHCKIISRGLTTFEEVKNIYPHGSPYNNGCCNNCLFLFCSPHWPSRVNSREPLQVIREEEEDVPDVLQLNESLLFSPNTPGSARAHIMQQQHQHNVV